MTMFEGVSMVQQLREAAICCFGVFAGVCALILFAALTRLRGKG